MKSYLLFIGFLIGNIFFVSSAEAQQFSKDELKEISNKISTAYFNRINKISPKDGFRNQFINEPDSMEAYFWEGHPQNSELALRTSIDYRQVGGQTLISAENIYDEQGTFRLTYTYDAQNRPTGASISLLLGGFPIPAGNIVINRNAHGHITKSQLTFSFLGNTFIEGDSTLFVYNAENKVTEAWIAYYDSEGANGPGWYLVERYYNIEYCGGDDICAMDHATQYEGFPEEVTNYTNLEWFGNGTTLFVERLQPDISEGLLFSPYLFLPEDPLSVSALSNPIGGEMVSSFDPGTTTLFRYFTAGENDEQLCLYSYRVDEFQDTILSSLISCHYVNEEGQLMTVENFFDLDLQDWWNTQTFTYNDYGYNDTTNEYNSQTSSNSQNIFAIDNGNRLRKIESIYSYTNEIGFTESSGLDSYYFYDGISSVVDEQIYKSFVVFPNPSSDYIFVAIESGDKHSIVGELRMRNLKGELILSKSIQATDRQIIEIGLSQYPAGMYILEAISADGKINAVSKFIKH
jgi:hypothetical protein